MIIIARKKMADMQKELVEQSKVEKAAEIEVKLLVSRKNVQHA